MAAVFSVHGDFAGLDVKGTTIGLVVFGCTTESNWSAAVTGRLGAAVLDRGLVYVKGARSNADRSVTS